MLADPRLLARSVVAGVPLMLGAVCAPLAVRLWFGSISREVFWSTLTCMTALFVLGLTTVALVFRWLLLRGIAATTASIGGCLAAVPTLVATYLGMLAAQRVWPGYPILDPSEPGTISFQTMTALADSLPLVAAWGTFLFLPTLWRAHSERRLALLERRSC